MEENAEEIIQEAVEIAGVNADLDQGIEAELQNLDQLLNNNNSNMRHVVQLQQQQGDGDPGPSGDSVLIIERDEHNTIHEFAHTCLLYTSPSPRDGLLSRMPSSA